MEDGMSVVTEILVQGENIPSRVEARPKSGRVKAVIRATLNGLGRVWNGIGEVSRRNVEAHNRMQHAPEGWDYTKRGAYIRGLF